MYFNLKCIVPNAFPYDSIQVLTQLPKDEFGRNEKLAKSRKPLCVALNTTEQRLAAKLGERMG
jgi:hypothetical protein